MRTKTKALALALCAVLLVVSTVFVTMAFLTDRDSVKNTFTFGQVGISLDEADVDVNGVVEDGENRKSTEGRVQANEYHLIPGHNYVKDPTIHVDSTSEDCWLFVKLENGLKPIVAGNATFSENDPSGSVYTIEAQMEKNGWTCVDTTNNIWAYGSVASKNAHVDVFDKFELMENANVSLYGEAVINLTAYAVQADGFATATDAWEATSANFLG